MKLTSPLNKDDFKIDINNKMYWSPTKILSYDFHLAMVEGGRGIGKTTQALGFMLLDYIKRGKKFVYVRRYKPEIKQFVDQSKSPLAVIVDGVTYRGDKNGGYTCLYGGETIGYAIPLSTSKSYKSVKFQDVGWILFDEFTIKRGQTYRYISDEVTTFMELVSSIVRTDKDYRILMLGNNLDLFNPYYQFFDIPLFDTIYWDKKRKLVCERPKNSPQLLEEEKKTPLYALLQGTSYGEYHYNNKLLTDATGEIKPEPPATSILVRLVLNGETLNINLYPDENKELNIWVGIKKRVYKDEKTYTLVEKGNSNLYYVSLYKERLRSYLLRYYGTGRTSYENERALTLYGWVMDNL